MSESACWQAAPAAELAWEDDDTPRSRLFDDIYYSRESGIEETRHVFLQGNQLQKSWSESNAEHFVIAETGFGSGLNFLCCWQLWSCHGQRPQTLHFRSIEKFPLRREELRRALEAWPELAEFSQQLIQEYPEPLPGQHRLLFDKGRVILDLVFSEASTALQQWQQDPSLVVNSWFLDGFAPSRNPDMWQPGLYQAMAALSAPGTRFATFTAAGHVRRGLQDAGFEVERVAGYGSKREMSRGIFCGPAASRPLQHTPWHLADPISCTDRKALVIGAGLAGSSVASSLAQRGWEVQVLESYSIASAASGNLQGVLYTRLSHRYSPLNHFALHSFCHAIRLYRRLFREQRLQSGLDGDFCGVLHLQEWADDDLRHETAASLPGLAQYLDAAQVATIAGLDPRSPGLFFPQAGWMNPPAVCRALLQEEGIQVREDCGQLQVHREGDLWHARNSQGALVGSAAIAIICCGTGSANLADLEWLPLQAIRGQVTHLPQPAELLSLKTVVCHEGYIAPARAGEHCLGATFDLQDKDTALREGDHRENLQKLERGLGLALADRDYAALDGRVAYRCASPDYLPLAGPVPDLEPFLEDYAALRRNARRIIPEQGHYQPGLYLSTGHGSRGLTSTPLCGELLASQICGEPAPLEPELMRALSPARFPIRQLIRDQA